MVTEKLGIKRMRANSVPKMLIDEQRNRLVIMCQQLLDNVRHGPNFLENVITDEDSWVFEYDLER